ncbi:13436_t:CDS:2, partial [Racocetra fulgida]
LDSYDDLNQLDEFERIVNEMIKNHRIYQKDIFDPFYCMMIDLVKDHELWSYILSTNLPQIKAKSEEQFKFITPEDIVKINRTAKDAFDNFNPQDISFESSLDLDTSIEYLLPHIDISYYDLYKVEMMQLEFASRE